MNFGITVLLIISGWAFVSIVVSLGFGGIAKARDRAMFPGLRLPASDHVADAPTDRATQHTATRRSA